MPGDILKDAHDGSGLRFGLGRTLGQRCPAQIRRAAPRCPLHTAVLMLEVGLGNGSGTRQGALQSSNHVNGNSDKNSIDLTT